MRGVVGLIALALGLSGCVGAPRGPSAFEVARQKLIAEKRACAERFETKLVLRARCLTEAEDRTITAHVPYLDLFRLHQATRLALAEKQEKKQITEAEARLQLARMDAQIVSEAHRRESGERIARAQEFAASAALESNDVRPYEVNTPRPPVTCTTYGAMTTCR